MKKTDYVLILIVIIFIAIGFLYNDGTDTELAIEFPIKLTGEIGLNKIDYSDYKDMLDNDKDFAVVFVMNGNSYCEEYMNTLKEYIDESKIAINYIDIGTLTDEEMNDLSTSNSYLKNNQLVTPLTLLISNKTVVDSMSGVASIDLVEKFFKNRVIVGG